LDMCFLYHKSLDVVHQRLYDNLVFLVLVKYKDNTLLHLMLIMT